MLRRFAFLCVALALAALPVAAEDEPFDLDAALGRFATTPDGAERLALALRIAHETEDAARVGDALANARSWPADAPTGDVTWTRTTSDGVTHTIFFHAPQTYTPDRAWPLMVWLHGGISRDQDGGGQSGVHMFADEADQQGFLILAPSTQNGAHWWSPAGAALIRGALLDAKRRYRVDADRVVVMGFSDGGSGAYHLLLHDPSPYAAFVPMMGNPYVTRIFGGPTWTTNVASRPVYAVNGGKDPLYPSAQMKPVVDALRDAGATITWIDEPDSAHEPSFLERRWDEIHAFWMDHPRDALPSKLTWASSAPRHDGRFAWLEIVDLDPDAPSAEGLSPPAEMPLPDTPPRPRLGIRLDLRAGGDGLAVEEVEEGTPAAEAGFEAGDRIVRLGDEDLDDEDLGERVSRLRGFLDGLGDEDGLFVVRRGEEEIEVRTRPRVLASDRREFARPADLGYDVPPGVVEAEASDNTIALRTAGVGRVRLHLAEPLVNLDREVVVTVNGRERWRGKPRRDVAYLLAQAAELGAGAPRYEAAIDVDVK
jgi:poly(3-hydroxybutyrate) depolymerase